MDEKRLLIVDDEENMCHMLTALLTGHGYVIETACDGMEASAKVEKQEFDFILCDIRMPNVDGLEFLDRNRELLKKTTIVMMSAYGSIDLALEAMKNGAYDFISKPFKTDEVLLTLKKAEEREQLRRENHYLKKVLGQREDCFRNIIGKSKKVTEVLELAEKVAPYDTTVLITGESGTGKELIARGIHELSQKGRKPFFAINCGSIPADLLESELFGYMKGAFTGADQNKKGIFEEAHGSTLFLDEIGDLPLAMQVKLLRVLQENEIRPIGASFSKKIKVRIIAATSQDLQADVERNIFRQDLFYRLNVMTIHMPSLHERLDDIPELCSHFIQKYNISLGSTVKTIDKDALTLLLKHKWPGNVRELENVIQRGMVLADGSQIEARHIPEGIGRSRKDRSCDDFKFDGFSIKNAQKSLESTLIQRALEKTKGNKSKAAVLLEISYPSLLSKIKDYSL